MLQKENFRRDRISTQSQTEEIIVLDPDEAAELHAADILQKLLRRQDDLERLIKEVLVELGTLKYERVDKSLVCSPVRLPSPISPLSSSSSSSNPASTASSEDSSPNSSEEDLSTSNLPITSATAICVNGISRDWLQKH